MLTLVTQQDVIYRRVFDEESHAFIPDWKVYFETEIKGIRKYFKISRQMVLFHIERRKSWRMLQSRAGVINEDYSAQKHLLVRVKNGEVSRQEMLENGAKYIDEIVEESTK